MSTAAYQALDKALLAAGVPPYFVNGVTYPVVEALVEMPGLDSVQPYTGVLLHYLPQLVGEEAVWVVRALTETGNVAAIPELLRALVADGFTDEQRWFVGNALAVIEDPQSYPAALRFCQAPEWGDCRRSLLVFLAGYDVEPVYQLLVSALNNPALRPEAIRALGRREDARAIAVLQNLSVPEEEALTLRTALHRLGIR